MLLLIPAALLLVTLTMRAATDYVGQVIFNDLPVPGATVTATQGDKKITTTTGPDGVYRLTDLADGAWSLRVEMIGFSPATQDITLPADAMPKTWEMKILTFDEIAKTTAAPEPPPPTVPTVGTPAQKQGASATTARNDPSAGFRRAEVAAAPRGQAQRPAATTPPPEPPASTEAASDGLLINGSVNNGAASPFAQPAAFGNSRRRPGALYTAMAGMLAGNSAWDARPYSFSQREAPKQDYNDLHFIGMFQGPLKIPGMVQRRPNLFVGYQRTANSNATTSSTIVPTLAERNGDFSRTTDAAGNAVRIVDPRTGQAFDNNQIPVTRVSPQALSLMQYYPLPNVLDERQNFQTPILSRTTQDSLQTRVAQGINNRNQLTGTAAYQRTTVDSNSVFGFQDQTLNSVFDTTVQWNRRFSPFFSIRPRFQYTQTTNSATPYFAHLTNVSGEAGISGNDQSPENWGPPTLAFISGIEALNDIKPAYTRTRSTNGGGEAFFSRGRHFLTFGGDARRTSVFINAQQDPRGRVSFNGQASGYDFADFLLGIPKTSTIATGNPDKYLHQWLGDAYLTDDLRLTPSLTLNLGLRWEFEGPMTEKYGRLVNLDVTSDFSQATQVLASDPQSPLSNQNVDSTLVRADFRGIQPRTALAWRPIPGSSVVVRASYGIYRNTNVYQALATQLAQQPPLSRSFSIENTKDNPFTLANPFNYPATFASNTFAVDPGFRVGSAHNWQASIQRDLPASLTVTATYLGTHGTNLIQEFLPNTNPPGALNPCPTCPVGFVYVISDGHSSRHAGQFQLRRRLRNGLTWTTQYTLAKAMDNATAFSGVTSAGANVAQDWRDLDAEWGPSSFDQRHQVTAQVEYTTGVGVRGGGLLTGTKGALFKGWTISSQMTTGSAMPISPIYLTSVPGTAVLGPVRASLTGASTGDVPAGYYLNPAAYTPPASGQWGTAGRNSARGAQQFNLNLSITRSFPWTSRRTWDWRIDMFNVLNRVTYSSINTLVGTPQFGLPNSANQMRHIQTSLRLRF